MDSAAYRDFKTSRGFTYHYFFSPPTDANRITLLFCHGFPSSSYDWRRQVAFFKEKGYGLVVPDLLGYGGTDRPTTAESYRMSVMAQDLVEILDHEKVTDIVAIGHDWQVGSPLVSRLAYHHQERFVAFGTLASAYMPPDPNSDYKKLAASTEEVFGCNLIGYWEYFASDDAPKLVEEHIDSFHSLIFPSDPLFWKDHFASNEKTREWIASNRVEGRPSYLSEEELKQHQENLLKGGLVGPCCWYKAMVDDHTPGEERSMEIDPDKLIVHKPVFYGAALQDYICLADFGKAAAQRFCPNARIVDFETDHWIMMAAPDKLNTELLDWLESDVEGFADQARKGVVQQVLEWLTGYYQRLRLFS
ncbi:alpha/beta-hydrolase [Fomitiporia mediterranea MF3/22]|uniref:alpha/beta-hydrolase n=1 Tax=Fomitiporia mediterranea (strain MF3/22) TaxID=694068 RepID=UPI000440867B|nr:alpha/beta-hydrolase [Fomitiporia mediterranea MF3/22]EJD04163.1 alpha/beta-hydrolase [Fomitiporia mediterranea MF3/22]